MEERISGPGRRLSDDVIDISEQVVAGAAYPLFHKDFTPDALATKLGDGVDKNDKDFRANFPYLALPNDGFGTALAPASQNSGKGSDNKSVSVAQAIAIAVIALLAGTIIAYALKKRSTTVIER